MSTAKKRHANRKWAEECQAKRRKGALDRVEKARSFEQAMTKILRRSSQTPAQALEGVLQKGEIPDGLHRLFSLNRKRFSVEEAKEELSRLAKVVRVLEPRLDTSSSLRPLWVLSQQEWRRPIEGWRPKGKSRERRTRELAAHLLATYPVPPFVLEAALAPGEDAEEAMRMAVYLGGGGSLYKATRSVNRPLLARTLTRKMCHIFLQIRGKHDIPAAMRMAQLRVYGAPRVLIKAIVETELGREIYRDPSLEAFWAKVLQWLVNQPDLETAQVGPIVDYLRHRRTMDASFEMKGRTVATVTKGMEAWHKELAVQERYRRYHFAPSGIREGSWEFYDGVWEVREILTRSDLAEEGKAMRHCVFSYAPAVSSGGKSIWSLRHEGTRLLTLEVLNGRRAVVQIRGKFNRLAKGKELKVLGIWASDAGLSLRR